jgi:hypothetical protein
MTQTMGTLLPSFTVNARLAGHLAALAVGHSLVIGYFASRRCGVVSGDFTVSWGPKEPTRGYVALRPVESVPVFVDRSRNSGRADSSAVEPPRSGWRGPNCGCSSLRGRS